jgi:REP element-mobilizing transposase RayT
MVRWYHVILSAYGFWLPNDPRGSWSDFVHAFDLFRFGGEAKKVSGKRSYAHDPHDAATRRSTKEQLKFPPVRFDEAARVSIASGFARACREFAFLIHACAISYDHVHLVIARDATRSVENVSAVLKARATSQMRLDGTHPMRNYPGLPTPWARKGWSVFIDDEAHLASAIAYVQRHPQKDGLSPQTWDFVVPV